jgi:RNA polymerase sigma factor (TIGR02999 family)
MPADTTQLLLTARTGDRAAMDRLFARVYDELRLIARERLRRFRPGETLNTTGLVHETYLKLVNPSLVSAKDRAHFLALASRAMRFVLIDHARAQQARKRGGGHAVMPLDGTELAVGDRPPDLLAVDRALDRLRTVSERQSQIVEYRFFGGLSYEEIGEATGRSVSTVKRDWVRARTWLYTYLQETMG